MNKVNYLRKHLSEQFEDGKLENAAAAGESLLREHRNNRVVNAMAYANDLFNIARVYDEMGRLDRAADLYAESARYVNEQEGESLAYASRLNNLAAILSRLGFSEPAFYMYAHMTAIQRLSIDGKNPVLADGLYNLANAAADIGRIEEAIKWHKESLEIRKSACGNKADLVHSLHSLAFLYEKKEKHEDAVAYAKSAVALTEEDSYPSACFYLAELYESSNQHDKALPLYKKVLKHTEKQGGKEHSAYLNVATRLANLLARDKPKEALKLHGEVGEIFKKMAGENHLFYANCLRSMAILHAILKENGEAEKLMLQSIKIRRSNHDEIMVDAVFLIEMYMRDGFSEKAADMLVYALMQIKPDKEDYEELRTILANAFTHAGYERFKNMLITLQELNDPEKLRPIMERWISWEGEPQ